MVEFECVCGCVDLIGCVGCVLCGVGVGCGWVGC